jgi:phosphoenolpyruvate-protein phosphotransferase/dihydroxyacetone kinase phosphotransfer subunit
MVGLVIVSHSNALSRALVDLVRQVTTKDIPVSAVGGVGADREAFGTDAVDIVEAIKSVYSPDGVVVLMDLGSAILSAETALELLPEKMQPRIRLCAAPIVEGALAAGVQISLGDDLEIVCREATQALIPKLRHLAEPDKKQTGPMDFGQAWLQPERRQEITLTVNSVHGLHARPAARFVQTATAFDARIWVRKLGSPQDPVSAVSLNSLATLSVNRGDRIVVSAAGPEAQKALEALAMLVNEQLQAYNEDTIPATEPATATADGQEGLAAIALSEGIALGPIFHYRSPAPEISHHRAENPDREWEDLLRARDKTCEAILQRRRTMKPGLGEARAAIFDAHLLIIRDPALLDRIRQRIFKNGANAAWAWQQSIEEIADTYRQLSNDYLRQRADDVVDVGRQVLLNLLGQGAAAAVEVPHPAILVAGELTPTDTVMLDARRVLGIVTVAGGPTSHSAILARALGIPAIAGVDPAVLNLAENTLLALDGFSGTLWIHPSPKVAAILEVRRLGWLKHREQLRASGRQPAVTRDGRRITVAANLGSVLEAGQALENGADGVGLLRTEFLFLRRRRPPAEAEQVDVLRRIAKTIGAKPICARTLDVGGDKPLPYLRLAPESNPYLGLRAVRLSLRYPAIFRTQLRAILQAGAECDLRLMFPMIATTEEVDRLLELRDAVHQELAAENVVHRWPIPTGIMIETPAAALLISSLVGRLDFFSIGTNDLTQYTLAAERGNAALADYADALHPVILRLIRQVVDEAHRLGKPVAVCGELAADPVAVPVLVGLGVDELSLAPHAIPDIKAIIRRLAHNMAVELVEKMLATDNAGAARSLAADFFKNKIGHNTP